ncbi:STAS domain-containing protein [Saccharothrix sp. HUAS TT1]|uniref:STAS domain-containing protein n=1 Tax=unclassified Saccharothrix TaxID=2593673 RepID=UPI00345C55C5
MEQEVVAASAEAVEEQGVPVLRVSGEVDMGTTDAVRQEMLVWLDTTRSTSVIDLSGVTFLASSGLALLVEAAQHSQRRGTAFILVAGHRAALRPLRATSMDKLFTIHPDLDQAVAAARNATATAVPSGSSPEVTGATD